MCQGYRDACQAPSICVKAIGMLVRHPAYVSRLEMLVRHPAYVSRLGILFYVSDYMDAHM